MQQNLPQLKARRALSMANNKLRPSTSPSGLTTPPPQRGAPESPDGTSLRASVELYSSASGTGSVHISKKIVVASALLVGDLKKRTAVEVWGSKRLEHSLDVWREESAPIDESLFMSLSASIATGGVLQTPRDVAKMVVRKVLREGWLPTLQWDTDECDYPPFPTSLIDDSKLIIDLCSAVKEELARESHVVEVRGPSRLFGDIHGQFLDLLQFFHLYGSPDQFCGNRDTTFVFLGDFVDRGFYSLEVLLLLFSLKIVNPSGVILVRGNHESRSMSFQFGFREELEAKLGSTEALLFFEMFNDVFDHMPLACLVGEGRILCMHGGLGPNTETIAQIVQVPKPLRSAIKADEDNVWLNLVARDLLWSDPGQSCDMGFTDHPARGVGVFKIGPDAVKRFLDRNMLQLIVRGHECVSLGFAFNSAGRVMTLFSAINYCGDGHNSGAILDVGKDLLCIPKIIRHVPDPSRQLLVVRSENRLRESMHGDLYGEDDEEGQALAVALFPFQKEKPLELTLCVGDVVEIINSENPEWLWVQNTAGETGYVPRLYLGRHKLPRSEL